MGIDLLSGIIGGLFGNHETPAEEPDISEPTYGTQWSYGQFVADVTGAPGTFNGQVINPQQGDWGTSGLYAQIGYDINHLPIGASSNPQLESLIKQLDALNPNNASNGWSIDSESQGMFTLGSGKQISVQDYMQLMSEFLGAYKAAGGTSAVPTFELSRTYPNLNISHLHQVGDDGRSSGSGSGSGSSGSDWKGLQAPGSGPLIHLDLSGATIAGAGGLQTIVAELELLLQRAQQGQIPGAYKNSFNSNQRWPWPS